MQKVEAPYSFVTPPAARLEDRTQPMGPLEEGDQALVDAANSLPEGEHILPGENGEGRTRIFKHESPGQTIAIAEGPTADGGTERASTLINKINMSPESPTIMADTAEWPTGTGGGHTTAEVIDNKIRDMGESKGPFDMRHDRDAAQATKLEIAGQIDAAREKLGHDAVEGAQRAA